MVRFMVNGYGQTFSLIQKPQKINPKSENFQSTQSMSSSASYCSRTLPRVSKNLLVPGVCWKNTLSHREGNRGSVGLTACWGSVPCCLTVRLSTCQWLVFGQGSQGSYFRNQQIYDLYNFYPKHDFSLQAAKFVCVALVS